MFWTFNINLGIKIVICFVLFHLKPKWGNEISLLVICYLFQVSVYTPPEQIQQAEFALKAAKGILEHYENFFGIKYPLPKLGNSSFQYQ